MKHCLVTFLGAQREGKYHTAKYNFPDGHAEDAAFLGFPLRKWLKADRLVVLGTAGSMWDHLFEGVAATAEAESALDKLMETTAEERVAQSQLDELAPLLARSLGCYVQLKIIPTALEPAEQTLLVRTLADAAEGAEQLSLDVTHGFRHLPMLAFTAALYLRAVRPQLAIGGLWYGEFKSGNVTNLVGLLETADWLSALQRHDWVGDYEGIATQIEYSGNNKLANSLREASHFQAIHQEHRAETYIRNARKQLEQTPMQGPGQLFQSVLINRMSWVDETTRHAVQRRSALDALARKDYMRAALVGREAFITLLTEKYFDKADVFVQDKRNDALDLFFRDASKEHKYAFNRLNGIRIVMAHANKPDHNNQLIEKAVKKAIQSQASLHQALQEDLNLLLS